MQEYLIGNENKRHKILTKPQNHIYDEDKSKNYKILNDTNPLTCKVFN